MALEANVILIISLVSMVHLAITDDPTYIHFWVNLDPMKGGVKGKRIWNPNLEAETTEAKIVLNKTMISGVACAAECLKRFKKISSTEACTGYNWNGKDLMSKGRCVLVTAFDAADDDLKKTIVKVDADWSYYDLECPNGKPKDTFCD
ncbi:uncharacterized protein LOC135485107 [Lineus longissimus]|uniref:uncharacterized protein LOC135485107 n=1 Tax=Lineus longissimus TaxID=88925 RepID=UPI002B4DD7DA